MSPNDVIRAWKDEAYRLNLSESEQAQLPRNPAGLIELTDDHLSEVDGATTTPCITVSLTVSVNISCWESIAHGSCGAFTWGCCQV